MIISSKFAKNSIERKNRQFELIDYYVKNKLKTKFFAKRVRFSTGLGFINFLRKMKPIQNQGKENKIVRKSVRIDELTYKALQLKGLLDESSLSNIVNVSILKKIDNGVLNLIEAKYFDYKITINFTTKEYENIKENLEELKERGLKVTFSQLARSILYEELNLVTENQKLPTSGVIMNIA
jgi:hypothetical protein